MNVDATAVIDAFARVLLATEASQGELDRLDAVAGDGDHGVTMVLGWRAVVAALSAAAPSTPGAALRTAAEAFATVGGSAGPLWGTALLRAGRAAGDAASLDTAVVARAAVSAAEGMKERGRSSEGDRTVVDAMAPAARTLEAAALRGSALGDAVREAAEAAAAGAEATATMVAKRGRAAHAPDRAHGHPDAGARACAVFWAAVACQAPGEASLPGGDTPRMNRSADDGFSGSREEFLL